jgi:hypothetical protein
MVKKPLNNKDQRLRSGSSKAQAKKFHLDHTCKSDLGLTGLDEQVCQELSSLQMMEGMAWQEAVLYYLFGELPKDRPRPDRKKGILEEIP